MKDLIETQEVQLTYEYECGSCGMTSYTGVIMTREKCHNYQGSFGMLGSRRMEFSHCPLCDDQIRDSDSLIREIAT